MIETMPSVALATFGAVLGAVFGSFIATLTVRWPQGRSIARGRSACDDCGAPIPAHHLLPLISFAWLRGQARCCGARIDRVHPAGELLGATIGALAVLIAPLPDAVAGAIFGWLLLALALLDDRHFWLPDRLTIALALLGLAAGASGLSPPMMDRLIGGLAGYAALAAIRRAYRALRGRDGMGGGDAKLFGAIGLWLGWQALPLVLLAASLMGLAFALILMMRGRAVTGATRLPFGLFLAIGGWIAWVVANMA